MSSATSSCCGCARASLPVPWRRWLRSTAWSGPGIATPDHVLTVAGDMDGCPATEPEQVYDDTEPYPSVCPGHGGAGC